MAVGKSRVNSYKHAYSLYNDEEFFKAKEEFDSLNQYEDSEEMYVAALYGYVYQKLSSKSTDIESAEAIINSNLHSHDEENDEVKIQKARYLNESKYQEAMYYLDRNLYAKASSLLEDLSKIEYLDSAEILNECRYIRAVDYIDDEKYEKAVDLLIECSYMNSKILLNKYAYILGVEALKNDSFEKAEEYFSACETKEADQLKLDCRNLAYAFDTSFESEISVSKALSDLGEISEYFDDLRPDVDIDKLQADLSSYNTRFLGEYENGLIIYIIYDDSKYTMKLKDLDGSIYDFYQYSENIIKSSNGRIYKIEKLEDDSILFYPNYEL